MDAPCFIRVVVLPDGGRLLTYFDITDAKRREAELRETLDQQTATTDVLQVINGSPGDLAPVFDLIADKAMQTCDADFRRHRNLAGRQFRSCLAAQSARRCQGVSSRATPVSPGPRSGFARVARETGYLHFPDLRASELYRENDPLIRALVELGGARTGLTVPLVRDERGARDPGCFSPGGQTVFGQADRFPAEFRDAGDDRDGKCAPAA